MRLSILAIGRARGPCADLYADYARRLSWPVVLREFEGRGGSSAAEKESRLLLAAVPEGARVIVCDERGKTIGSTAFASKLGQWRDNGVRDLAFLIGGADGHTEAVRARADLLLSFGAMTWPHQLARVMLIEQVYRAHQILSGHPYHRA